MSSNIHIEWPGEGDDYGLYCPACGEKVAPGPNPCEHVDFIWLEMEPREFEYVSKRFEAISEKIHNTIYELEDNENDDIDEELLRIDHYLDELSHDECQFTISVCSSEYSSGENSDFAIFGFSIDAHEDE